MPIDYPYERRKRIEKIQLWIIDRLPERVIYRAAIKLMAYGTTGRYSSQVVPELTITEALKRWHRDHRA
jgi:hypothetical protein